jgi:tripartite-type tricarboxylate transporter receptor subunit TctC
VKKIYFKNKYLGILLAGIACVLCATAGAQNFPSKPIRLVIPFSTGAASDFLGRTIGQKLGERYGQQVVSDNRPGAGGVVGSTIVAKANPDGYTLMVLAPPHLVNALIHKEPQYRAVEDYTAISQVATLPNMLVVPAQFQAKTVKDLVALAKAKPGSLNFGSAGIGSLSHLGGALFVSAAGIDTVHIPFKLFSDALTEMFAARVHFYVSPITAVLPHARDGKLRALAVTSASRVPTAQEVPTMNESGLPAAQLDTWFGIAGPAGMQRRVVDQLNRDIAAVLQDADTRERIVRQGATPAASTPEQLAGTLKNDFVRFRKIIADAGLKPQ